MAGLPFSEEKRRGLRKRDGGKEVVEGEEVGENMKKK